MEKEHTNNTNIAKQIAKAHLVERKNYYTLLKKYKLQVITMVVEKVLRNILGDKFKQVKIMVAKKIINRILKDNGLDKKLPTIRNCDFCKNRTVHYGKICGSCLKVN